MRVTVAGLVLATAAGLPQGSVMGQRGQHGAAAAAALLPARAVPARPAHPHNITVYHVVDTTFQQPPGSPEREWPIDMNTADLGGDMYFDIGWGQLELLECARNSSGGLNFSKATTQAILPLLEIYGPILTGCLVNSHASSR